MASQPVPVKHSKVSSQISPNIEDDSQINNKSNNNKVKIKIEFDNDDNTHTDQSKKMVKVKEEIEENREMQFVEEPMMNQNSSLISSTNQSLMHNNNNNLNVNSDNSNKLKNSSGTKRVADFNKKSKSLPSTTNNNDDNQMTSNGRKKIKLEIDVTEIFGTTSWDNNKDAKIRNENEEEETSPILNMDELLMVKVEEEPEDEDVRLIEEENRDKEEFPTVESDIEEEEEEEEEESPLTENDEDDDDEEFVLSEDEDEDDDDDDDEEYSVVEEKVNNRRIRPMKMKNQHQQQQQKVSPSNVILPSSSSTTAKAKETTAKKPFIIVKPASVVFRCGTKDCNLSFNNPKDLESHVDKIHRSLWQMESERIKIENVIRENMRQPKPDANQEKSSSSLAGDASTKKMFRQNLYRCRFKRCSECFVNPRQLEVHFAKVHGKRGMLVCDECGESCFSRPGLSRHQFWGCQNSRQALTCSKCKVYFPNKTELESHISLVHHVELKVLNPKKVYTRNSTVIKRPSEKSSSEKPKVTNNPTIMKLTLDDFANRGNESESEEESHLIPDIDQLLMVKVEEEENEEFQLIDEPVKNQLINLPVESSNQLINSPVESSSQLVTDRKNQTPAITTTATPTRIFYCSQNGCHRKFRNHTEFEFHITTIHKSIRKYMCEECGECCRNNANFFLHQLVKHGNRRPKITHECSYCTFSTFYINGLVHHFSYKHVKQLKQGWIYRCDQCGLFYSNEGDLDYHIITEHSNCSTLALQIYNGELKVTNSSKASKDEDLSENQIKVETNDEQETEASRLIEKIKQANLNRAKIFKLKQLKPNVLETINKFNNNNKETESSSDRIIDSGSQESMEKFECPYCTDSRAYPTKKGLTKHCSQCHANRCSIRHWCVQCDIFLPPEVFVDHLEQCHSDHPKLSMTRKKVNQSQSDSLDDSTIRTEDPMTTSGLRDNGSESASTLVPAIIYVCPYCDNLKTIRKANVVRHCKEKHLEEWISDYTLGKKKGETNMEVEMNFEKGVEEEEEEEDEDEVQLVEMFVDNRRLVGLSHEKANDKKSTTKTVSLDLNEEKCESTSEFGAFHCRHPNCEESFAYPGDLECHLMEWHRWPRMFICDQCGEYCCSKSVLALHQNSKHDTSRQQVISHVCPFCPSFRSSTQRGLIAHCFYIHREKNFSAAYRMCLHCFIYLPSEEMSSHCDRFHSKTAPKLTNQKIDLPDYDPKVQSSTVNLNTNGEMSVEQNLANQKNSVSKIQKDNKKTSVPRDDSHQTTLSNPDLLKSESSSSSEAPATKVTSSGRVSRQIKKFDMSVSVPKHTFRCPFCNIFEATSTCGLTQHCKRKHPGKYAKALEKASKKVEQQQNQKEPEKEPTTICCPICEFKTTNTNVLAMHCKERHPEKYAKALEKVIKLKAQTNKIQPQVQIVSEVKVNKNLPIEVGNTTDSRLSKNEDSNEAKLVVDSNGDNKSNDSQNEIGLLSDSEEEVSTQTRLKYTCDQCDKKFDLNTTWILHHTEVHGTQPSSINHRCPHCTKYKGTANKSLIYHCLKVHPEEYNAGRLYRCDQCEAFLPNELALHHHIAMLHSTSSNKLLDNLKILVPFATIKESSNKSTEVSSESNIATVQESEVKDSPEVEKPEASKSSKTYACPHCSLFTSTFRKGLIYHCHKKHPDEFRAGKVYKCDQCNTFVANEVLLDNHIETVHLNKGSTSTSKLLLFQPNIVPATESNNLMVIPSLVNKDDSIQWQNQLEMEVDNIKLEENQPEVDFTLSTNESQPEGTESLQSENQSQMNDATQNELLNSNQLEGNDAILNNILPEVDETFLSANQSELDDAFLNEMLAEVNESFLN